MFIVGEVTSWKMKTGVDYRNRVKIAKATSEAVGSIIMSLWNELSEKISIYINIDF